MARGRGVWMLVAGLGALPGGATAQDLLPYGGRIGMNVTIYQRVGIDSADASIRVVHTAANAREYCTLYLHDTSEQCVLDTGHEVSSTYAQRIEADCETGTFTSLWGDSYRFGGRAEAGDGGGWVFEVLPYGERLDRSLASGYDSVLAQFRALCPARLR